MGLPAMNVIFAAAAKESVRRAERGIVGMIIKDTAPADGPVLTVYKSKDIPQTLSAESKEQIALALKGYVDGDKSNGPSKIVVYVLGSEAADYVQALKYFALHRVNWLVCPTVKTDEQADAVTEWVKEQRGGRNKVKAVLPETAADDEGIVNFTNQMIKADGKEYTAESYCGRIAGLLAGIPMKQGATFAPVPEAVECDDLGKGIDAAIDAGKFLLYYDGEKIKVARAVNSLTTVGEKKTKAWKKIKVVETMDMISSDIALLAEDNYIGKYVNNYDNKCLLLSAIKSYLDELVHAGIIADPVIDFDLDAIREYLMSEENMSQEKVEAISDAELKKADTGAKVFLSGSLKPLDVMEDMAFKAAV